MVLGLNYQRFPSGAQEFNVEANSRAPIHRTTPRAAFFFREDGSRSKLPTFLQEELEVGFSKSKLKINRV